MGLIGCFISFLAYIVINLFPLRGSLGNLLIAVIEGEEVNRISIIPIWLMVFAILFSIVIGLSSGYYSANKAVQIPALEDIKSE